MHTVSPSWKVEPPDRHNWGMGRPVTPSTVLRNGELGQAGGGTPAGGFVVGSTALARSTPATSTAATKLAIQMASRRCITFVQVERRRPTIAS